MRSDLLIDRKTAKRLKLKAGKPIGTARVKLAKGKRRVVTVKLSRAAKRKVKRLRSLRLTVKTTATDAAGNSTAAKRKLRLKR